MRHIWKDRPGRARPICGAKMDESDELVTAAMKSDCSDCRVQIGIIPPIMLNSEGKQEHHMSRTSEQWEPQPIEGFPSVEELVAMRDGR